MDENRIPIDLARCGDFCEYKLCYIAAQGFNLEDPVEYDALIDTPNYRCDHCGRHANSQIHLCKPEPL